MAGNNQNNNNNNKNNNIDGEDTKQGNLVVRIDQDSDDNLQALFDMALKPQESKRPHQLPFRMRNLPSSFFNPPSTGSKSPSVSHSRENSADSAFGSGTTTICSPSGISTVANRLQISHSRAHSSPASLQQTYAGLAAGGPNGNNATVGNTGNTNDTGGTIAAATTNQTNVQSQQQQAQSQQQVQQAVPQVATSIQPVHMKQRSYDVVSAIQLQEQLGDLPPGWEQARTSEGQIYYLK